MADSDFPKEETERSITERFAKTANRFGERTAVRSAGTPVSYAELNRRAGSLARAVVGRCGGGSTPVAICLDHDTPAVVAILGVLQAGKIYVPVDPSFPRDRNRFILEDSGAELIIGGGSSLGEAKELAGDGCALLDIDSVGGASADEVPALPRPPDNPASILYSSGSTGRPKGIVHSHRSILHHVWDHTTLYRFTPGDRFALLVSCSFAASVSEIFGALLNGASLSLFPLRREGHGTLARWIGEEGVSVLKLPAPVFRQVLETLKERERVSGPRVVLLGGDTLYRRDVDRFREHFPADCILVNRLTSTETNTISQLIIGPGTEVGDGTIPVGQAARDKEITIVDGKREQVENGREGEITVRSRYLSSGYRRQPELTSHSFREEAGGNGERTYFTGDRGVMGPDGILLYRGRQDDRVKIRGFRIETGEVEAALLGLDAVREAAVVDNNEPATGERRLCAYLVPADPAPPTIGELRRALDERLPREMIPTAFVFLEQLPATATGKIDRRALPDPREPAPRKEGSHIAPRSGTEKKLAEIWEELLGIEGVGIRDDFFDLGGHSFLAVRLSLEIEKQLGGSISLAELMQSPTIGEISAILAGGGSAPHRSLVPVGAGGEGLPFYCVSGMGGHGMIFRDLAGHLGGSRPLFALEPIGLDGGTAPRTTVEGIAAGYLDEIVKAQPEGPYLLGGYSFGGVIAYEMAQQLHRREERIALLALIDTAPSFLGWAEQIGLSARMHLHLRNLGLLTGRERLAYLYAWLKRTVRSGKSGLKRSLPSTRKSAREKRWQLHPALHHATLARMAIDDAEREEGGVTERIMLMRKLHQLAVRFYRPRTFPGRIALFACEEEARKRYSDPLLGWERLAERGVEVHQVPGDHYTLLYEPHVGELAEALRRRLDDAGRCHERGERPIREG